MTVQMTDTIKYKDDEYSLIGMKGKPMPSPMQFGMEPIFYCTACYRCYQSKYEVNDEGLFLREMTFRTSDGNYLPIDGTLPDENEYDYTYHNLNVFVPFSGAMRLVKGFIQKRYIHMGFQRPSSFRTVLDIALEDGKIVEVNNRSKEMAKIRKMGEEEPDLKNANKALLRAFSLDMDRK